jgi:hypothetical protein
VPALAQMLPPGSAWQAIGIGRYQLPLSLAALALGVNLRVGFEDNIYLGCLGEVQRVVCPPGRRRRASAWAGGRHAG